ncbi:hypothetical protein [Singulisphaera sp. PoT]|uniref:hypothetical protein n=1 Tax=Singulisphaera sp. PoT TaxID=3411797 RepID=UPI003BF46CF4
MSSPRKSGEAAGRKKTRSPINEPTSPPEFVSSDAERVPGSLLGGRKRRRGASDRYLGSPSRMIPQQLAIARGHRLPATKATKAQEKALETLVISYIRRQIACTFGEIGVEAVSQAMNVSPGTIHNQLKELSKIGDPWRCLVLDFLLGIQSGKYSGPRGHRMTSLSRWVFGRINYYGLGPFELQATDDEACIQQLLAAFRVDILEMRKAGLR